MLKRILSIVSLLIAITPLSVISAKITLNECVDKALNFSALKKQYAFIDNSYNLENKNLTVNYFPSMSVDAQASYQSDVFAINLNLPIPGIQMPKGKNDQYQTSLTLTQMLWDGGATSKAFDLRDELYKMDKLSLDAKLYKIKELVNNLYFSILLMQENKKVLLESEKNLQANQNIISSAVKNGVTLKSSEYALEIEQKNLNKNVQSLESDIKSSLNSLSILTGENLQNFDLEAPLFDNVDYKINRKEISVIDQNQKIIEANSGLTSTQLMPVFAAFVKAGVGNPNPLNQMQTEFKSFYIAGLKMSWTPFDWNKNDRKRELLEINKQIAETEKSELIKNIQISMSKDLADIEKYNDAIKLDEEISVLQEKIAKEKFASLNAGAITATEYVVEFNKSVQAKLNLEIDRIKLINAKINILNKSGNQ